MLDRALCILVLISVGHARLSLSLSRGLVLGPRFKLSGTILAQISALVKLVVRVYRSLEQNELKGSIPSQISLLTGLEYLYAIHN